MAIHKKTPIFFLVLTLSTIPGTSASSYYEHLSVNKDASSKEIKTAYRRLARATHPDKFSGAEKEKAETVFVELSFVYDVLSDRVKRARYDHVLSATNIEVYDEQFDWTAVDRKLGLRHKGGGENKGRTFKNKRTYAFEDASKQFEEVDEDKGSLMPYVIIFGTILAAAAVPALLVFNKRSAKAGAVKKKAAKRRAGASKQAKRAAAAAQKSAAALEAKRKSEADGRARIKAEQAIAVSLEEILACTETGIEIFTQFVGAREVATEGTNEFELFAFWVDVFNFTTDAHVAAAEDIFNKYIGGEGAVVDAPEDQKRALLVEIDAGHVKLKQAEEKSRKDAEAAAAKAEAAAKRLPVGALQKKADAANDRKKIKKKKKIWGKKMRIRPDLFEQLAQSSMFQLEKSCFAAFSKEPEFEDLRDEVLSAEVQ